MIRTVSVPPKLRRAPERMDSGEMISVSGENGEGAGGDEGSVSGAEVAVDDVVVDEGIVELPGVDAVLAACSCSIAAILLSRSSFSWTVSAAKKLPTSIALCQFS